MTKFTVKWTENRVINVFAEIYAENVASAIKKAQSYSIDEEKGEYLEEIESHTDRINPGTAQEIEDP